MKLLDSILLAIVAAFFIIGIYHTFVYGIIYSYIHFMIVIAGMLWLNMRGAGKPPKTPQHTPKSKKK